MNKSQKRLRRNANLREWCKRNPRMRFMRYFRHRLKSRYGMTPEQFFEEANAFGGNCFICQRKMILPNPETRIRNGQSAVVDHDHERNMFRGITCNNCNRALGFFRDVSTLKRAIIYLDAFNRIIENGTS